MRLTTRVSAALLLEILVSLGLQIAGCQQMTVIPESDARILIGSPLPSPDCSVCLLGSAAPSERACSPRQALRPKQAEAVHFSCPEPQNFFTVEFQKEFECSEISCSSDGAWMQSSLFTEFNRTFTWHVRSPKGRTFQLDFSGTGMRQILPSESCPDLHKYTVLAQLPSGLAQNWTYCRTGSDSQTEDLIQARVSLQLPWKQLVDLPAFKITSRPRTKKRREVALTPDASTVITISKLPSSSNCSVCTGDSPKTCASKAELKRSVNATVRFTCENPQDFFTVDINKEIECNETSCSSDGSQIQSSFFPDFNRTFSWDLKAPGSRAFQMDFSGIGLRQIFPSESCPDFHKYTVVAYPRIGPTSIGVFCRKGVISRIQVLYKTRVSLRVPGNTTVELHAFKVSTLSSIRRLAIMEVDLLPMSAVSFLSPNYPGTFPDDDLMTWKFNVPAKHNSSVSFVNYTEPTCLKKEVMVEYQRAHSNTSFGRRLGDKQTVSRPGNFNMSLRNCEMEQAGPGLSLHFQVAVTSSRHPVLCMVDLQTEKGLVVKIDKVGQNSDCEMKTDSVPTQNITMQSGNKYNLSFLDCGKQDLTLTITKSIECHAWKDCSSVQGVLLSVPTLESCLPVSPQSITWHLIAPQHGAVELTPGKENLRQSLPGQECNGNFLYIITEEDGSNVGTFCQQGAIEKVQVHANLSVTMVASGKDDLSKALEPPFNVSFTKDLPETYVFTVSPKIGVPTLLATPDWPKGMKEATTLSWIVSLPPRYRADLEFLNVSQPHCYNSHTEINVQLQDAEEEMFSRREDEMADSYLSVPESFWFNLTNCQPESQDSVFSMQSKITLQKKKQPLLSIILGAVGVLLFLSLIVLIVICVIVRKKKKKQKEGVQQVSIYNPNGNSFFPGRAAFPKRRADNESHIYAAIEDTMVYGHLLREQSVTSPPVDMYRTFKGPVEDVPLAADLKDLDLQVDVYRPFISPAKEAPPSASNATGLGDNLSYVDHRMVDNELYTFKASGDPTSLPLPDTEEEAETQMEREPSM
ncbi:CUB domain-containing protein 1 [Lepisosteus oculatus]|uniref:CUB domain-containing protein 1 n=1 Tax=Lepisosteus oculatus TaxID=7918 RepID=UPI0035F52477